MRQLCFKPIAGRAGEIIDAILQTPEVASCSRESYAIHLVSEELVVNVVSYAYADDAEGYLKVNIDKSDDMLVIEFVDGGVAFNPLEREQPDTSLALEDRSIGGLGIFLTTQMMDDVAYRRTDNENILTIKKRINNEK